MPNFWSSPWARRAPGGIGQMHLADQGADVGSDWRPTVTSGTGTPAPMPGEQTTMPRDDRGGFHDLDGSSPAIPHAGEQHPHEPVGSCEAEPFWRGPLEDGELVAEGEDLGFKFGSSS